MCRSPARGVKVNTCAPPDPPLVATSLCYSCFYFCAPSLNLPFQQSMGQNSSNADGCGANTGRECEHRSGNELSAAQSDKTMQLLIIGECGSFQLNIDGLKQLLLDPSIADKNVAIISVTGAFRKGKSFLLNFLLRYLNSDVSESPNQRMPSAMLTSVYLQ